MSEEQKALADALADSLQADGKTLTFVIMDGDGDMEMAMTMESLSDRDKCAEVVQELKWFMLEMREGASS